VSTPAQGLARLRAAAVSGELDELCRRHAVRVLTVFGSAARGEPDARDLDVGLLSEPDRPFDASSVVADLIDLTGVGRVDLAHLNRAGPLLRERALVGCVPLYESRSGAYAAAQTAAIGQRIETDAARRADLELLRR
jgi:predicted nucleotidyltransferase